MVNVTLQAMAATDAPARRKPTDRSLRRQQVLSERQRAIAARRRRGYAVRRPDAMPIVVRGRLTSWLA